MANLKIGELAKETGTSVETLRYYETEGLIPAPRRTPAGYRIYSAEDLSRVNFIRRARGMGFSLREVAELLTLQVDKDVSTCGDVKLLAEQKLVDIDVKIGELNKMKAALLQVTEACRGGEASAVHCTILNSLSA